MSLDEPAQTRSPWLPALVIAIAVFAGSVLGAAVIVGRALGEGDTTAAATPFSEGTTAPGTVTATPTVPASKKLRYTGTLPVGLPTDAYEPASKPSDADVTFELPSTAPEAVPHRYFVPVVPLHAGIDSVTRAQLDALLAGTATFAELGGLGGAPELVIAGPAADRATLAALGIRPGRDLGESYDVLFAAMKDPEADLIALVPLDALRVAATALAVDGVDIARGRGDATAWPFVERISVRANTKRGQEQLATVLATVRVPAPTVTTVVATGDILQSRCSLAAIIATGDWGAALRGPVGEYLAAADLALGSLDGSIQDIGEPYLCVAMQYPNLTSPPEVMEALTLAGIDGVTVATNHIFDCGQQFCGTQAFTRTLELLEQAGIKHVGGGANLEAALAPAIFEVNGIRYGVLGFDDVAAYELEATETEVGTAPLDDSYAEERAAGEPAFFRPASELTLTRFTERIRLLKTQVDVVIVQVQSGTEDTHDPSPRSIKALRAAADAGADLVIGNQAHHAQAVETRDDVFIAYALGNFIFDQVWTPEHTQGYLVEASFLGKQLIAVRLVPYQIEGKYKPTFVTGALRTKILRDVFDAAAELPAATP